jgi:5-methyltetrahydropteroyltriglutamate--homocysteine methyltransferase
MAGAGPLNADVLSEKTGLRRYAREWLNAMAASRFVDYDATEETYALSPEAALVFAEEAARPSWSAAYDVLASVFLDLDKVQKAFANGTGLGWHEHNACLFSGTEAVLPRGYNATSSELDPVARRHGRAARAGARVATSAAARRLDDRPRPAYPASSFVGYDYHEPSIVAARERARAAGVADRVRFEVAGAKDYPGRGFDLVAFFDCLHDMGDPVGAAKHVRETLADDGIWMIVEPFANDRVEDNLNPVGRIFYSVSTMVCTPCSLAQEVGLALGAQAGEKRLRRRRDRGGLRPVPPDGGDAVQPGFRGAARRRRRTIPDTPAGQRRRYHRPTMNARTRPPFRADHVGSFLRPKRLLEAREKKAKGEITPAELRAVEDRAIAEIVKFQEDVGLQSITDGEFRRTYFHIDFLDKLGGVKTDIPVTVVKADGTEELAPPVMRVVDKVRHVEDIQKADFEYLKSKVSPGRTPKVTIPSPTMLHFRGGRAGISREAYPELEPPSTTTSRAPTATSCARSPTPAAPTCRWTTPTSPTCATEDARGGAHARRRPERAAAPLRRLHQQGRRAQARRHDAGDAPVPRQLQEHARRGRQLRAGRRGAARRDEPRRLLPRVRRRPLGRLPAAALPAQGKIVVLGLVTTKFGEMESKDALKRRIDEAAKYVPLEQLCLSPQCGFSSTVHGNNIAVEAQRAKLRLVVETADEVWGRVKPGPRRPRRGALRSSRRSCRRRGRA